MMSFVRQSFLLPYNIQLLLGFYIAHFPTVCQPVDPTLHPSIPDLKPTLFSTRWFVLPYSAPSWSLSLASDCRCLFAFHHMPSQQMHTVTMMLQHNDVTVQYKTMVAQYHDIIKLLQWIRVNFRLDKLACVNKLVSKTKRLKDQGCL